MNLTNEEQFELKITPIANFTEISKIWTLYFNGTNEEKKHSFERIKLRKQISEKFLEKLFKTEQFKKKPLIIQDYFLNYSLSEFYTQIQNKKSAGRIIAFHESDTLPIEMVVCHKETFLNSRAIIPPDIIEITDMWSLDQYKIILEKSSNPEIFLDPLGWIPII